MKNRIVPLDIARGLMLLSMTFNHLAILPFISLDSLYVWIRNVVYGRFGFLSNSEGFFFLAGITAGVVYGRLLIQGRGLEEVGARIRRRIAQLYASHVLLLLAAALFLALSPTYLANWKAVHALSWDDQPHMHYFLDRPFSGFALGCALLYLPCFFDLYFIYIFFLSLAPFLLNQLQKGRAISVLAFSLACYIAAQYDPGIAGQFLKAYLPVKLSWFHPGAVQLLFIAGLVAGFLYAQGRLPNIHHIFLGAAALSLGALALLYMTGAKIRDPYNLGIVRLMVFGCKAYVFFLLRRALAWEPFALLGRHALPVFGYHLVLVYFLVFFLPEISRLPLLLKSAGLIASLATIWIPAYFLEKRQKAIPRPV